MHRAWGQSWPFLSIHAPFARGVHVPPSYDGNWRPPIFYILVMNNARLVSGYIPVDLYPKRFTKADGVQPISPKRLSPLCRIGRLCRPEIRHVWDYPLCRLGNGICFIVIIPQLDVPMTTTDSVPARIVLRVASRILSCSFCSAIGPSCDSIDGILASLQTSNIATASEC